MNIIGGGRGGAGTSLFGLFIYLGIFVAYLLLFELVAMVVAVVLISRGIKCLYRHHQAQKAGEQEATVLLNPPMPAMSRVQGITTD